MMAKPAAEPRRSGHQDDRRHRRAACLARAHPAPQCAVDPGASGSAARPATSAASAPSSARAFCSAIPLSRIAPCSRSASQAALTPWWPRSTAASAICAPCSPALKISTRRTSACRASRWRASAGLTFKGTPESITPHPMAEFRRVPDATADRQAGPGRVQQRRAR